MLDVPESTTSSATASQATALEAPVDTAHGARTPRRHRPLLILGSAAALLGLVGIRFASDGITGAGNATALPDALADAITLTLSILIESFPFVVLGIAISVIVGEFVPADRILARLPRSGLLRRASLSLLGAALPVCECGNVPLARGLLRQGLSVPEALTFVLAAPILNPVTIATTWQAFGSGEVLWGRVFGGFLIANLVGWVWSRHPRPESALRGEFAATCSARARKRDRNSHSNSSGNSDSPSPSPSPSPNHSDADAHPDLPQHAEHAHPGPSRLTRTARAFADECAAMLPALILGAVLAALVQTLVPRDTLVTLGESPIASVFVMLGLAFVVSICSTVDAFFALTLAGTFSAGSLVTFLVFGAMIDVKMLALLRTTFTARTLALITVIVALLAIAFGFGVNLIA